MLKKIILVAFILRIFVGLLGEHGDVVNVYWWSKDLVAHGLSGFYDRDVVNTDRPNYPPMTSYLFLGSGLLHETFWKVSWSLHLAIKVIPGRFIWWLESDHGWYIFNKLPAIFADLGIIYLIYLFVKDLKDKKTAIWAAAVFAFVPVFWYNSSLWGQTDSIFALPALFAFCALYKNKIKMSAFLFTLSVLTKPTALFVLPIFAIWWLKKVKVKDFVASLLLIIFEILILYLPFHSSNIIPWIIAFYQRTSGGVLSYMVANAFNLWALFFGFDNRPDSTLFLGIPANILGYALFFAFTLGVIILTFKSKPRLGKLLLATILVSYAAFIFLPRIHDRYFYPTLIFMIPLAALSKTVKKIFWFVSTIHLINLYHFWWVPRIPVLISIFSNVLVEKTLIIANLFFFVWLTILLKNDKTIQKIR